jgi:predicted flavoprotein YhiN
MIKSKRKTYVVGEMLDWEAPTGGYLLQACISNGAFVAKHIIREYS